MDNSLYFRERAYALKPLFAELMQSVAGYTDYDLRPFCIQWGRSYPTDENTGIMFYGRATNGWITTETDVDKLFDPAFDDRIFARDDQMQWIYDCAGTDNKYNSNRSAFWRIIRQVARGFYPSGEELLHVCWSNVCKIAPDGANPDNYLYYDQLPACQRIMQKEIEIFSPKHVVLLTGKGWAHDFLFFLNDSKEYLPIASYTWGSRYCVKDYKIGEVFFYLTEHPQGKDESTHAAALIRAISDNM